MSDTPNPPSGTEPNAEGAPAAPAPSPADAASPAAPSPASKPTPWSSLLMAAAVAAVGGFILARAGSGNEAKPLPQRVPANLVRNVPANGPNRLPPQQIMQRLRQSRAQRTAAPPSVLANLPPAPAAALEAPPGAPRLNLANAVLDQAGDALRPQVDGCLAKLPPSPSPDISVAFVVHREPDGASFRDARVVKSNFGDSQVQQCVLDAVGHAKVPRLSGTGDVAGTQSFGAGRAAPAAH
jgi:hypothetical protein